MNVVSPGRGAPPAYDTIVVGDQVVMGDEVGSAGIAIAGERIAGLLDVQQARPTGLAATRSPEVRRELESPGDRSTLGSSPSRRNAPKSSVRIHTGSA